MDPTPQFSTIVVTYRRDTVLAATIGHLRRLIGGRADHELVLVDNNADGIDREPLLQGFHRARLVRAVENTGVAGGRNLGIKAASGEVLVFLDDDAFAYPPEFLDRIGAALSNSPDTGILAFKSLVRKHGTWGMDPCEFPHTDKSVNPDAPFETFRFIGVGHAVRSAVFREVGLYLPEFFYSMEEFDLSYRALKRGWRIEYRPEIWVLHMRDKAGRDVPAALAERALVNKMRVAWMHLPWRQMLICMAAWSARTAIRSGGRANVLRAWAAFLRWRKNAPVPRLPMPPSVMAQISACGGQPWK